MESNNNWRILPIEHDDPSLLETIWNNRMAWNVSTFQHYKALYHTLRDCQDVDLKPRIEEALDCLHDTIRLFGRESLICSFNGGKDAVVILHLVCAVLAATHHQHLHDEKDDVPVPPHRPRGVYFDTPNEFPELRRFTHETVQHIDMDMLVFPSSISFVEGLTRFKQVHDPCPLAFCLGTRDSDPNAHGQGHFAPSSSYMPAFMRVNPILHWNYGHVWHFLRKFHIPYCTLYDQGYTSLGSVHDTLPCPALRMMTTTDTTMKDETYLPAYMLQDWDQERAGRVSTGAATTRNHRCTSTTSTTTFIKPDVPSVQSVSRNGFELLCNGQIVHG
jgi:FAD synthetase